ncbi:MAG: hypothetical protein R6U40_09445, partial [Desulfobacterales bacterium]
CCDIGLARELPSSANQGITSRGEATEQCILRASEDTTAGCIVTRSQRMGASVTGYSKIAPIRISWYATAC